MAHFAKINENNEVTTVLTLDDKDMLHASGAPNESIGQQYLERYHDWPAQMWIQTSKNTIANTHKNGGTALRGNYAGKGFTWDAGNQIFWPQKPYPSWVKHIPSASWKSPIGDIPELTAEQIEQNLAVDENTPPTNFWVYNWNESTTTWDLTDLLA